MANKAAELKLKSYSTTQLEKKLVKATKDEAAIINTILAARKSKKSNADEPKELPKKIKKEIPQEEVKPEPKKTEPKKTEEVKKTPVKKEVNKSKDVVVKSADKKIQKLIDSLTTIEGKELESAKESLTESGISVDYLDIVNKGDEVKFQAAGNSKYRGETFSGVIINNTDSDRNGKKYCKVRTEKYGVFQKQQSSLFVTSRTEE